MTANRKIRVGIVLHPSATGELELTATGTV